MKTPRNPAPVLAAALFLSVAANGWLFLRKGAGGPGAPQKSDDSATKETAGPEEEIPKPGTCELKLGTKLGVLDRMKADMNWYLPYADQFARGAENPTLVAAAQAPLTAILNPPEGEDPLPFSMACQGWVCRLELTKPIRREFDRLRLLQGQSLQGLPPAVMTDIVGLEVTRAGPDDHRTVYIRFRDPTTVDGTQVVKAVMTDFLASPAVAGCRARSGGGQINLRLQVSSPRTQMARLWATSFAKGEWTLATSCISEKFAHFVDGVPPPPARVTAAQIEERLSDRF